MIWKRIYYSIIALIAVGVDSKCGDFYSEQKLEELPSLFFPTRIGAKIKIELPRIATANYVTYHLTNPKSEELNLTKHWNNKIAEVNFGICNNLIEKEEQAEVKINHDKIPHDKSIFKGNVNGKETNNNEKVGILSEEYFKIRLVEDGKDKSLGTIEVGPLTEEHFGNWVITMCSYNAEDVVETFKVFSVHITEPVKTVPDRSTKLKVHEDFKVRLERPIRGLRSCELIAPATSFDREYDRDLEYPELCGFLVRNVSAGDNGRWMIIAVGHIVHEGSVDVEVVENKA